MGRLFLFQLENAENKRYYCCRGCQTADGSKTYIALEVNILYKDIPGSNWQLADFTTIVNEVTGYREHTETEDGVYIADEVYCVKCLTLLGWKYISVPGIHAIKVGKFLMERSQLTKWQGEEVLDHT